MYKKFILIAALLAALSVALGAFGAHLLKQFFTPDLLVTYETAVRYQMYHSVALLMVGILQQYSSSKALWWAGWLFIAGILLFSGSLYIVCSIKYLHLAHGLWVGAITPLGGLCFIGGWLAIVVAVASKKTI
jgi:uncharacterized membrane protein YgdD (TMEM256/DUF423 family)